jgi:FtsP/CotA-like multicopper oxidase with cupredoxin domain
MRAYRLVSVKNHSHTNLQEQRGVYGSIVVEPAIKTVRPWDKDMVLVLSDWTNEDPGEVLRTLKRGSSISLTPRLELIWTADTDEEWEVGAEYTLTKHLSISGSYHSEFDGGAGLLVRF